MATLLIFLLFILACVCSFFRFRKCSVIAFVAAMLGFVIVGTGILPSFLLNHLQSSITLPKASTWGNKNAIVLLGGGAIKIPGDSRDIKPLMHAYSRISKAAAHYLACKKSGNECTIIVSGGDAFAQGKSEAEVYRNELLDLGINTNDIMIEPKSMNTFKNAEYVNLYLKEQPYDRVYLVTSGIHLKRSLLYFAHFGTHAIPVPSDYLAPQLSFIPHGFNFAVTDFALHEYAGILRFHLYNLLGWNIKPSASPGSV